MDGLNYLGCEDASVGIVAELFQTAGGLMQGAANAEQQDEASDKKKADQEKILNAAIAADVAAANAFTNSIVSTQFHTKTASSDAQAATTASAAQDSAGNGLEDAGVQKRIDAANVQLANAQKNATAKPKDAYTVAVAKAWTNVLAKLQGGGDKSKDKGGDSESWLTRRVIGPLPGYAVLVGLGVVALVARKILAR